MYALKQRENANNTTADFKNQNALVGAELTKFFY
jgi:hypothetical protein